MNLCAVFKSRLSIFYIPNSSHSGKGSIQQYIHDIGKLICNQPPSSFFIQIPFIRLKRKGPDLGKKAASTDYCYLILVLFLDVHDVWRWRFFFIGIPTLSMYVLYSTIKNLTAFYLASDNDNNKPTSMCGYTSSVSTLRYLTRRRLCGFKLVPCRVRNWWRCTTTYYNNISWGMRPLFHIIPWTPSFSQAFWSLVRQS